ncbi:MAG TPA: hypothetical protein VFI74_04720 [Candidatus Saccharimonadales bacterium]|nr:hypothetical protein [Candidatus Saccharimonadales bacterium]
MSMYPEQPPLCTTTGTECQPCPAGAEPRNCRYLALGQTIVEQKIEISGLQEDIAHLTLDPKLPNTLNLAGLYLHAQKDPFMQEQLRQGTCGFIFLDVRGLSYVNGTFGHDIGDLFLEEGRDRIHEALTGHIRAQNQPVSLERRNNTSAQPNDEFARLGGDEFGALLYNIGPADFERRTREVDLSVDVYEAAIRDQANDEGLPIIASVAGMHMTELPNRPSSETTWTPDHYVKVLKELIKQAGRRHDEGSKIEQYSIMAAMLAISKDIVIPFDTPEEQKDNARRIAAKFFPAFLPNFVAKAKQLHNDSTA